MSISYATRKPRRIRRGISPRTTLSIACTIFSGGALLLAARLSQPEVNSPPQVEIVSEEESISVFVPTRIIARGEQLKDIEFISIKWPKSKLSGSYLTDPRAHLSAYALSALPAHLPIPTAAISASPIDANAVAEAIPSGMRAITVKVDAESAVEGWARSGNFIDVILVRTSKENSGSLESQVIAENVKILSAGASAQPLSGNDVAPKAPNTVTILVSQENALKIKTAANIGRLTFALRGTGDSDPTITTSLDQRRLFGQPNNEAKPQDFIGRAKGPDGRTYVLAKNSKWLRSSESVSGFKTEDQNVGEN